MRTPPPVFIVLAAIAVIEGVVLLGYGAFDLVSAIRFGVQGPQAVSNTPALVLQILIFAVFGIGLGWVARGWWRQRRWARAPFLLAQVIALVVGFPLISSAGSAERIVGLCVVAVALVGGGLSLAAPVSRVLDGTWRRTD